MSRLRPARQDAEEQEAMTYAEAILIGMSSTDWKAWNQDIIARWSLSALMRVKKRAWQIVEYAKASR